jgi:hypothetical protein
VRIRGSDRQRLLLFERAEFYLVHVGEQLRNSLKSALSL